MTPDERLMAEVKRTQALVLLTLAVASYRPARPKAWYEKGIIGDITWGFR